MSLLPSEPDLPWLDRFDGTLEEVSATPPADANLEVTHSVDANTISRVCHYSVAQRLSAS